MTFREQMTDLRTKLADTQAELDDLRIRFARTEKELDAANARIAELDAEYRRLWNAGIDHVNSGGTVESGLPEITYAALFRALMQSRFWNESIVANAAPGAQRDAA